MKYKIYIVTNEKGATSILVIFMMIVLVTLGAFAITSALVNYRFAFRAADWNRSYYAMENQAEIYKKDVSVALLIAADNAAEQMVNERVVGELNARFEELYIDNVIYELGLLKTTYANQRITSAHGERNGFLYVENEFTADDNVDSHLTVKFFIKNPDKYIDVKRSLNKMSFEVNYNELMFDTLTWQQWQTPVELPMTEDLWPGDIEVVE